MYSSEPRFECPKMTRTLVLLDSEEDSERSVTLMDDQIYITTPTSVDSAIRVTKSCRIGSKVFQDYEFVGDSHLVRLMCFIGMNGTCEKYPKRLGVAQGGAAISTILANLKNSDTKKRKAIVCAGTNDLLRMFQRKTEYFDQLAYIKSCLKDLYNTLTSEFDQLIWVQIPPILKLKEIKGYEFAFQSLNKVINAFGKLKKGIRVVNVSKVFKNAGHNMNDFYEEYMGFGDNVRPDLIHINRRGMRLLEKALRDAVRQSTF